MKKIDTIYFASSSPRRQYLLKQIISDLNIKVKLLKPNPKTNIEDLETANFNELPGKYVRRIALKKAYSAKNWIIESNKINYPILTADTTVAFGGKILGKPKTKLEAFKMLKMLANESHKVITSVVLMNSSEKKLYKKKDVIYQITLCSTVWIGQISTSWLKNYVESGEPMDKSGGYGIQGKGQEIIKKINGSYSGIIGLPLLETLEILKKLNQRT